MNLKALQIFARLSSDVKKGDILMIDRFYRVFRVAMQPRFKLWSLVLNRKILGVCTMDGKRGDRPRFTLFGDSTLIKLKAPAKSDFKFTVREK